MKNSLIPPKDRGVAMLAVLFALLLLSVIGLGMMYSTNMESFINTNYRDKQVALYASMAGLQEARDRLQCRADRSPTDPDLDAECPPTINIDPPTDLPSLTEQNVVYIINPKNGETVAPWDGDNTYRDTELCHENILGLTATAVGVPCGSVDLPSVSTWYKSYDNSNTSAGPWHFSNPFDFKWARITIKTNNSTPVIVNGASANSNMACWDGTHQIVVADESTCTKFGSVVAIDVDPQGSGYTTAPTVTIDAPDLDGGVQATATANLVVTSTTEVSSVTLVSGGSGYTTAPTVDITGGGGSGATATATIVPPGAEVDSVSLSNTPTSCYQTAPAVTFSGGGGSGATATATLGASNTCIASWTVGGKCAGKKGKTVSGVRLSGSTGSGFSATLSFAASDGTATVVSIQNPGTSYTTTPTNITNLEGCGALTIGQVDLGKTVASVSKTLGGSGYTSTPTVSIATGTGTTATQPAAAAVLGSEPANVGQVVSLTLTSGGMDYTGAPAVTFTGTSTTAATATAAIGDLTYKVGSITVANQGSGYSTVPDVTITGGGGSGAMGTATIGRGSSYGKVYIITALAATATGARTMYQMEAATPVIGFAPTGALTIAGPDPAIEDLPASNNFFLHGADANSCMQTAEEDHPAVGGYDDPNDPDSDSVETITDSIPDDREMYYTGTGGTPSVENVYGSLGDTLGTTDGLESLMAGVASVKTNSGSTVDLGSEGSPAINYIDGNVTLSGNSTGYGILAVTGTLTMSGNFTWYGMIMVVGDGKFEFSGGGSGQINGSLFVAKIYPSATEHTHDDLLDSLGSPSIDWNGGGGNGIQYDHCWATNMMARVPFDAVPTGKPLKILSLRTLPY